MAAITGTILAAGATAYGANRQNAASNDAKWANIHASRESLAAQEQAQNQMREDMTPFSQFGQSVIPQAQQLFGGGGDQFSAQQGAESMVSSPLFQSLLDESQNRILKNQAVRGRLSSGETPIAMQDAALRTGYGLLSGERNDFLNAISLGQNAAAGTGSAAIQGGRDRAGMFADIGNATAAEAMAKANNQSNLAGQIAQLGAFGAGGGFGSFAGRPAPGVGGIQNPNQFGNIA